MKKPFQSKTVWFNLAAAAMAALEAAAPTLQTVVGGDTLLGVVAIGNILLRFVTTQPIGRG